MSAKKPVDVRQKLLKVQKNHFFTQSTVKMAKLISYTCNYWYVICIK